MVGRVEAILSHRRVRVAVTLAVVLAMGWLLLPSALGLGTALVDHARGKAALKRFGEPMSGADTFHRLMRERYGVSVEEAGCDISGRTIRYIQAYNWYAEQQLRSRFGRDLWAECEREAALAAADARE